MSTRPGFLGRSTAVVADNPELSGPIVVQDVSVGRSPGDGFWFRTRSTFDSGALSGKFVSDVRRLDEFVYTQDPFDGTWERTPTADDNPDPIRDAVDGVLVLDNMTVASSPGGFVLRGTYPADPAVTEVEIGLGGDDRLQYAIVAERQPRADFEPLVSAEGDDLYLSITALIDTYDVAAAPPVAPPADTATKIIPDPLGVYTVQIPVGWERLTPNEAAQTGVTDGYSGEAEAISLFVLLEFLDETGLAGLADYVAFIADVVMSDLEGLVSIEITTLQGEPAWLIRGTDPALGSDFVRLIHLSPDLTVVNVILVERVPEDGGPQGSLEAQAELVEFILNSFLALAA